MTQRKSYSRYFIILQEDEKGYELTSDKLPNGYVKLETKNGKCRISFYVQNLKKQMKPYCMVLICGKKKVNKLINLGEINLDVYGRVDTSFEYPLENIAGTGITMDKISGAAIVKINANRISCVMNGFMTKEPSKNWKQYEITKNKRADFRKDSMQEKEHTPEPIKLVEHNTDLTSEKKEHIKEDKRIEDNFNKNEEKKKENIFDEYENKIEDSKIRENKDSKIQTDEIKQEENLRGEKVEDKEKVIKQDSDDTEDKDNIRENEEMEVKQELRENESKVNNEVSEKTKEDIAQNDDLNETSQIRDKCEINKDEYRSEVQYDECPRGNMGKFFKELVEDFKEVKGVLKDIKRCKWYKINIDKPDDMYNMVNYKKYTVVYYPMMTYYPYISKYGYYLMGYKWDNKGNMKYIIYAIPGTKKEQPYGGQTGFVTWIPKNKDDSLGYWIMFYDFKDCTIAIPVKR